MQEERTKTGNQPQVPQMCADWKHREIGSSGHRITTLDLLGPMLVFLNYEWRKIVFHSRKFVFICFFLRLAFLICGHLAKSAAEFAFLVSALLCIPSCPLWLCVILPGASQRQSERQR